MTTQEAPQKQSKNTLLNEKFSKHLEDIFGTFAEAASKVAADQMNPSAPITKKPAFPDKLNQKFTQNLKSIFGGGENDNEPLPNDSKYNLGESMEESSMTSFQFDESRQSRSHISANQRPRSRLLKLEEDSKNDESEEVFTSFNFNSVDESKRDQSRVINNQLENAFNDNNQVTNPDEKDSLDEELNEEKQREKLRQIFGDPQQQQHSIEVIKLDEQQQPQQDQQPQVYTDYSGSEINFDQNEQVADIQENQLPPKDGQIQQPESQENIPQERITPEEKDNIKPNNKQEINDLTKPQKLDSNQRLMEEAPVESPDPKEDTDEIDEDDEPDIIDDKQFPKQLKFKVKQFHPGDMKRSQKTLLEKNFLQQQEDDVLMDLEYAKSYLQKKDDGYSTMQYAKQAIKLNQIPEQQFILVFYYFFLLIIVTSNIHFSLLLLQGVSTLTPAILALQYPAQSFLFQLFLML